MAESSATAEFTAPDRDWINNQRELAAIAAFKAGRPESSLPGEVRVVPNINGDKVRALETELEELHNYCAALLDGIVALSTALRHATSE